MTVRAGREFLAIPGPTTMPDEVLQAMHRPAIDIYSDQMLRSDREPARAISPAVRHQGQVLHLHRQRPRRLGSGADQRAVARRQGAGAGKRALRDRLGQCGRRDGRRGRGAATATGAARCGRTRSRRACARTRSTRSRRSWSAQVDTASGVSQRHRGDRQGDQGRGHPALFMVDTVASLGCMPFEMDAWGIDVAMSGSQKGLMTPPGLGFVAAGARAPRGAQQGRTAHALLGLDRARRHRALPQICRHSAGASAVRAAPGDRHVVRRRPGECVPAPPPARREATRRAVGVWSEGQALGFNVAEAGERSNTVTTVTHGQRPRPGRAATLLQGEMRRRARHRHRRAHGKAFRIAHMGHVNAPMLLGTLGVIEVGLNALKIPHGKGGVEAAIVLAPQSAEPTLSSRLPARNCAPGRNDSGACGGCSAAHSRIALL